MTGPRGASAVKVWLGGVAPSRMGDCLRASRVERGLAARVLYTAGRQ